MEEQRNNELQGCIKTSRGPWIVHRATKTGGVVTKYRFPSERERQNNKQREHKRRSVARKIFAGLRTHGNYNLPKHADSNDLLKALCEEAGWRVEEDGTISKKHPVSKMPSLVDIDEGVCECGDDIGSKCEGAPDTTLALSLKLS